MERLPWQARQLRANGLRLRLRLPATIPSWLLLHKGFLLSLSGSSGKWPDDQAFSDAWLEKPIYNMMSSARLAHITWVRGQDLGVFGVFVIIRRPQCKRTVENHRASIMKTNFGRRSGKAD